MNDDWFDGSTWHDGSVTETWLDYHTYHPGQGHLKDTEMTALDPTYYRFLFDPETGELMSTSDSLAYEEAKKQAALAWLKKK